MVLDSTFDVFLSHGHVDGGHVETIGARLEDEAKLSVWLDKWILIPGEHWQQQMAKGLDQAKCCAVCIGGSTPQGWFQEEIERSLNKQARESQFRVIPVILPGGNRNLVESFLELRTWVDFRDGITDGRAFHILLSGIRGVPPGRYNPSPASSDSSLLSIRNDLARIKELRLQQLIDEDIALEYQRRLMDKLIESGVASNA